MREHISFYLLMLAVTWVYLQGKVALPCGLAYLVPLEYLGKSKNSATKTHKQTCLPVVGGGRLRGEGCSVGEGVVDLYSNTLNEKKKKVSREPK